MEIRNLHQPFEVEFLTIGKQFEIPKYRNTFFEMVFILEGTGTHTVNDHKLPYAKNKLYLLFPQDTYSFEVEEQTHFCIIRFNLTYLRTQSRDWLQRLEFIYHQHNHMPSCILKTITDKPLVRALVEALEREYTSPNPQQQLVIRQLIDTILTVASRNLLLATSGVDATIKTDNAMLLLNYVQQNIYDPERLKVDQIAMEFNLSPKYVSEYFKNHTGQSLQEYINTYRYKIIETRLRYTDMRINEIVLELGLSDASHLNRLFKKHSGVSPSDYKRSLAVEA
ncbi:helix-turn-helix domain-containing protein [Mangrovibacterium diazotrophicum]|uniref:AraC family transcriptional regulator n=1 Tax=Mangrovibacterium diazotrophicum TaxID=1261403 RepID=A0A419W8B1_9BACT|nr:AraC family transcriptional regulator [Mangrovibacterium diazotrophicum]RKD91602.1 AraC family transcriptional regulator [Mangrovibacterium diazotrophicum]